MPGNPPARASRCCDFMDCVVSGSGDWPFNADLLVRPGTGDGDIGDPPVAEVANAVRDPGWDHDSVADSGYHRRLITERVLAFALDDDVEMLDRRVDVVVVLLTGLQIPHDDTQLAGDVAENDRR